MKKHTVRLALCGDPITGGWCHWCRLPSAVTVVYLLNARPMTMTFCLDCEADL